VAVGRLEGVKTIASIRGNDVGKEMFSDQGLPMLEYTLRNADYVTCVARDLLDAAETVAPVKHKARVILNSLDLEPYSGETGLEGRLKGAVIGTVGIIKYKKGLPYLFRAVQQLSRHRELSLLVVGDFFNAREGELHRELLRRAGIENRTTITGMVARENVPAHLKLMDVFVLPSLFSEGCPSALLEAMLARCPVVAARAGAIPEILADGENALLVPPGSSAALAGAIARLLDDRKLADRVAAAAHKAALGLSTDLERVQWLEVHEAVLSDRAREASCCE
jgi:glycosyltransferase involved in cell wall biosynthesis